MATFFDERQRLIAIILLSPLFRGSRYGSATLVRKVAIPTVLPFQQVL